MLRKKNSKSYTIHKSILALMVWKITVVFVKGYKVLVIQDEYILEVYCTT